MLYAQQELEHTHTNPQNAQCKYHIRVFKAYNIDFQNGRQALKLVRFGVKRSRNRSLYIINT